MAAATAGTVCEIHLLAHAHVQQHLRVGRQIGREVRERPAGQRDRPQHVERRAQAVAGEQVVGEDDVARLLAAERQARALSISSITYLSPTAAADQLDAERACSASSRPMLLITVATIASPFSRPSRCSWRPHISSTASPSTTLPAMVDEDRAIAVAVERDAHLAAALDDRPRQQPRDASTRSAG